MFRALYTPFAALSIVLPLVLMGCDRPIGAAEKAGGADWVRTMVIEDDYETVRDFLKSSIEEEGLTIANQGSVAEMMARTRDAVEGAELIFRHADIFQFCSAKYGAALFALSPDNIGACPLSVFSYQLKGETGRVVVGYRRLPEGAGKSAKLYAEIGVLLERIIKRAAE